MAEYVLGLEISVEESISVEIWKSSGSLEENRPNLILRQASIIFFGPGVDLVEVALEVVEDHVELWIGKDDLSKFNNTGMLKFLEALDFSKNIDLFPAFILALHFFDGDDLVIGVDSFEDDTERAISNAFDYLIFLHPGQDNYYNNHQLIKE